MTGTERFAAYCAGTGEKQEALAARLGISQGYLSMLLSGERVVTRLDIAARIEARSGGAVPATAWLASPEKVQKQPRRLARRKAAR